jgi:predicted DCC family thiol-disulfide oxidoreductase YuxK
VLQAATWGGLALELAFAPLALARRLRPWLWAAMLAVQAGLLALLDLGGAGLGLGMLHLFTFDPAWLRARPAPAATVFYDGHCGLCHRMVRFIVAEDTAGAFRFAPLDGPAFRATVPAALARALPDSVVVRTPGGALLSRTAAVRYVLGRLGGLWRVAGWLLLAIPSPLADRAYDGVARLRHRLFARPAEACPLLPPDLRARFDDR